MFTTLALSSLLLAAPAVLAQSVGTGSCTDVHIFIARGWNEDYPGRQGNLTTRVCNDLPGLSCDYEDIAYDAYSTDYCPSVDAGEALALSQINAYYAKCPNTAIVLSGYSEGATVMGNVLAGDTGDVYCPSSGHAGLTDTTSGPSCNIAAITLFGNPRHTANQPYNVLAGSPGMANSNRSQAEGLNRMAYYTPRLHDYCNYDDLICWTSGRDFRSSYVSAQRWYREYEFHLSPLSLGQVSAPAVRLCRPASSHASFHQANHQTLSFRSNSLTSRSLCLAVARAGRYALDRS